jgi:CheY-like chemotaxis protein
MRVLVVDDDTVFRDQLAELLSEEGHQVAVAGSVPKALEWLGQEEADVVLTDLKMPRHSGLELLKEVRGRWPRTRVVLITGFATVDTALEAMKSGAFDYVRKPFRIEQLRETLSLVQQQQEFESPSGGVRNPAREARVLTEGGDREVLYFARADPGNVPHLHYMPLAPDAADKILDQVRNFVELHPTGAVVISEVDLLLEYHRLSDVVQMMDQLRQVLQGHGPLRVGFDSSKVTAAAASAVGGAVAADDTQATLEAVSNPIRRHALQRLSDAPASFHELMSAAGIDDSPKMSFHVRKLMDSGLLQREGETYRLTERGSAVLRLITDATFLPPSVRTGNLAFPGAAAGDPAGSGPGG